MIDMPVPVTNLLTNLWKQCLYNVNDQTKRLLYPFNTTEQDLVWPKVHNKKSRRHQVFGQETYTFWYSRQKYIKNNYYKCHLTDTARLTDNYREPEHPVGIIAWIILHQVLHRVHKSRET